MYIGFLVPFGTFRLKLEDNIGKDLKQTEYQGVHVFGVAQDKDTWRDFVIVVMNIRLP